METDTTHKKRTVLVVDDEPNLAQMVKMWLEVYLNLTVVVASDGKMALSLAHQEMPDMILMDYMLPWLNGIEATRQLKADAATRHIPVVLYSNSPRDAGWMREAREAGCVHCVDKMMSLEEMNTLIKRVLPERVAAGTAVEEQLIDTSLQPLEPTAYTLGMGPAPVLQDEAQRH